MRIAPWRTWVFALVNLLILSILLSLWHRRRDSLVKAAIRSANEDLEVKLKPLRLQLEAEKKLADESLHYAITSQVREILAGKSPEHFGTALPDGLSQVQNPEFEIATPMRTVRKSGDERRSLSSPRSRFSAMAERLGR
jgi:hypothetical protein